MRDLDRLQEQDPDDRGRHVGVWLVLATTLLALFGAVYISLQRTQQKDDPDPLDQLVQTGQSGIALGPRSRDAGSEAKPAVPLDPTKLTFERTLTGEEDRPEVIAALEAAAREAEELGDDADNAADEGAAPAKNARTPEVPKVPIAPTRDSKNAQIPAGMTASSAGSKLVKDAQYDPLVAAAMPKTHSAHTRASSGSAGEYILQVMSYEEKSDADAFASALRDRGHEAFVAGVNVEGRGRTYRVRIGPFKSKAAADSYRREFEERERMNTIIVRRDEE